MLEYGEVFLEQNLEALEQLEQLMTPAGFEVACEIALQDDADEADIDQPRQAVAA